MTSDEQFDLEIAVVGMAGRFPGAPGVDAFWRSLRDGVESVRSLTDEELRAAGVDEATVADPSFVRAGAVLDGADRFDAAFFGFTPREAELMDPQFRVFLEDAWTALESAGLLGDRRDARVGVFAGASPNTYLANNVEASPEAARAVGGFQTAIGNARDYLATHVSYRLDLRGPSVLVQTACSTSLVAVHLAVQSLLNRECDVALAGGVSVSSPQTTGCLYEEGGIASPDGHTRAFDAEAAGCVKGNGSAVVVLKRLADALADGDPIRAVIKGSAVNNDGALKVGFTAPSEDGQASVVEEALEVAAVDAATIGYVETHGTATALGDPIEVAALTRAFRATTDASGFCAIGSVKTNVGHLDAAAGVAGLVKAVLAIEAGEIPPSLNFREPNPKIDFGATPFYVAAERCEWPRLGAPRRAGVSSFGIGGTNAHVVVEEAPERERSAPGRDKEIVVLSAKSATALEVASENLAAWLEEHPDASLADVAWTLESGRRTFAHRRALVASSPAEAAALLRAGDSRRVVTVEEARRDRPVAFLFPGQGAQRAGMARELYDAEPFFRAEMDRSAEVLRARGIDLLGALYGETASDERLRDTALAQPALFAVEYALARLWMSWGVEPAALAGHSVGEYVAAALAGVFAPEDAIALVAERGRLMGSMAPGAMLAIVAGEARAEEIARRAAGVSVAAVNGREATVLAGPEEAIAALERDLEREGVAAKRLRTSHAFHSEMMDPIVAPFEAAVAGVRRSAPSRRVLSNVTGGWLTEQEATDQKYWARHLRSTVRFGDNLAALAADEGTVLVEVGPGTALGSLARQAMGPERAIVSSLPSYGEAVGRAWAHGVTIDWRALHGESRRRVALPTYPFERKRYWIEPVAKARETVESGKEPDVANWFWVPTWRRSVGRRSESASEPATWMVVGEGGLARAVVERLEAAGHSVEERANAETPGRQNARPPDRVVYLGALDPHDADPLHGFYDLLALIQEIGNSSDGREVRIVAATSGLYDVTGETVSAPERAALVGPCRVVGQEYPNLSCRLADFAPGAPEAEVAAQLVAELEREPGDAVVAYRGSYRWARDHERVRVEPETGLPARFQPGLYILTDGASAIDLAIAERIASHLPASFLFLGCDGDEIVGEERLASSALVTDAEAVGRAVAAARERFGPVAGVIHTAGGIGGGMIQLKTREAAEAVIAPRVDGAALLERLTREDAPGLFVLFSSAVAETGVFGQVDFCGASAALDAIAEARRGATISVGWGTAAWDRWQEAGGAGLAALQEQLREIQESIGITVEEGVDALVRAVALGQPHVVVSTQDLRALVEQSSAATFTDFLEGVSAAPAGGATSSADYVAPATETERGVAAVWRSLLGVERIGAADSFFDLGGNSLLAIQLASHLRRTFEIDVTIASLFESQRLSEQAAIVDAAVEARREADEVAALLDEIERLSLDEVRDELARGAGQGGD